MFALVKVGLGLNIVCVKTNSRIFKFSTQTTLVTTKRKSKNLMEFSFWNVGKNKQFTKFLNMTKTAINNGKQCIQKKCLPFTQCKTFKQI